MKLQAIKDMIADFLDGKCDPYEFSFILQNKLYDYYDEIALEDAELAYEMDDTLPEICAEYEGEDPKPFMDNIEKACIKLFGEDWRNNRE